MEDNELQKQIEELQKQVEDLKGQLQKQDKLASLGLLSAGIAHEVQNPLNFVINFSKMSASLLKDLSEVVEENIDKLDEDAAADMEDISKDLSDNLKKIQEHGERAIGVIRGILLQSRGKSGEFLPVDLSTLVHEYVWLSYHAMRANNKNFNVSIQESYPEGMPKVLVVPQDISRAILNVMNNAFYTVKERSEKESDGYTPTVSVKMSFTPIQANDADVRIEMTDNGMGMSPETREHVFENFYTTKPAGSGTGLGMGIIRSIIMDVHKGQLDLQSKEGEGTTISFLFPVKIMR